MPSVVCTSTRTQVSQLFPNCKRVPRHKVWTFAFEILIRLYWKSDTCCFGGTKPNRKVHLRPSFITLCQYEETLSSRWNTFHGFKCRGEWGFILQQIPKFQMPRSVDKRVESWLFYNLMPLRLKLFKSMTSQQIIDHLGLRLPPGTLRILQLMLCSEVSGLRAKQSIYPPKATAFFFTSKEQEAD